MKTRDRILQSSLDLFNRFGEPNITTNHIANEMEISPGNLYYYFHNKDEIVYLLFQQFEQQITEMLAVPQSRALDLEDMWFFLHLIFESIWRYRFLYRDLNNLLSRNKKLNVHFNQIIDRKVQTAISICNGLVENNYMQASHEEIEALAHNIAIVATYWLNFQTIYSRMKGEEENHLGRGIYQVMSLVAPFLQGRARELLYRLSLDYL